MGKKLYICRGIALMVSIVAIFGATLILPVYAQSITVSTNKVSYQENEIVVISGKISPVQEKMIVQLNILYGEYDNMVYTNTLRSLEDTERYGDPFIQEDGTWTVEVQTGGHLWKNSDKYTVKVHYFYRPPSDYVVAETSFLYSRGEYEYESPGLAWAIDGTDFLVGYSLKNCYVKDMIYDENAKTLKVTVDGWKYSNGIITFTDIPKQLLDITTPITISCPRGVNQIVMDATTQNTQTTVQPQNTQETTELNTIEQVVVIPQTTQIPEWVRGVFKYWADGNISDQDLINAIKYLVKENIINLNK